MEPWRKLGLRSAGSPWFTPMLEIRTSSLKLSFKKAYSSAELYARRKTVCAIYTSHLLLKIIVSYITIEAINCLMSSESVLKSNTQKEGRNTLAFPPRESWLPLGTKGLQVGWRQEEVTGKPCLFSASRWTSLGPSAEFSLLLPTPSPFLSTLNRL